MKLFIHMKDRKELFLHSNQCLKTKQDQTVYISVFNIFLVKFYSLIQYIRVIIA